MNSILTRFSTSIVSAGLLFSFVACSNSSTLSKTTNNNPSPTPDTTLAQTTLEPLLLYWSVARQDNLSTATSVGEYSAKDAGYVFARVEGCVFPTQQPGTVPLKLYWHPQREDNFTTATPLGEQTAADVGYVFARVEGYVFPASQCEKTSNPRLERI